MGPIGVNRVRLSLQQIQQLYNSGEDRSQLENLIRAFRGIQDLPPEDPKSFFHLAGLHGLPYRGPGETDPKWWGGYCWHGSVLFPTWHRIYLLFFEDALRSIPRCQDVTLPFWDELAIQKFTGEPVIPSVLTSPTFKLDGRTNNPLYSYKLQKELTDKKGRYSKPANYETVRYPLSGLMGSRKDRDESVVPKEKFRDAAQNTQILNNNVTEWLLGTVKILDDSKNTPFPDTYSVRARFLRCLLAPNYTIFSNTASQNQWIKDHGQDPSTSHYVVSLESPHNAIHLAVGGFYQEGVHNANPIRDANGDMGDNETASFDPLFYLHHCFIDYTFSIWQRLWNRTKRGDLTVIQGYAGTILREGQPPNFPEGTHIDMTTPLYPFKKPNGEDYTSDDATDLNELGITYGPGSLDPLIPMDVDLVRSEKTPFEIINPKVPDPMTLAGSNPNVANPFSCIKWVHKISRTQYEGSFVVRLCARGHDRNEVEVGREAILSRWNIKGCSNCQNHLDVDFYVPIDAATLELLEGPADLTGKKAEIDWIVKVDAHDGPHVFPMPPDRHHGGEPVGSPKLDDL